MSAPTTPAPEQAHTQGKLYRIRPLKWQRTFRDDYQVYRTSVPMGSYSIERNRKDFDPGGQWEPWRLSYCFDEYYDDGTIDIDSVADGKAKAFEDWASRITPALLPEPPTGT